MKNRILNKKFYESGILTCMKPGHNIISDFIRFNFQLDIYATPLLQIIFHCKTFSLFQNVKGYFDAENEIEAFKQGLPGTEENCN